MNDIRKTLKFYNNRPLFSRQNGNRLLKSTIARSDALAASLSNLLIALLFSLVLAGVAAPALGQNGPVPENGNDTVAEAQRAAFREAYERARGGDRRVLRTAQRSLSDYLLWPDLVSAHYLGLLASSDYRAIEAHLERYPNTALNRTLRYRYAVHLAKKGATGRFLTLYDTHYAESADTELDCYAAHARLDRANTAAHRRAALDLWLVGKSQPEACDPLFHRLEQEELLTARRHAERLHLALAQGQLKLAAYLAKRAPDAERVWLSRWQTMRSDPATALQRIGRVPGHALRDELYRYGIRRAARRDPVAAYRLLAETVEAAEQDEPQRQSLLNYITLRAARDGLPEADRWFEQLTQPSDELARWRVRGALGRGDWPAVRAAVATMRPTLAKASPWQYFKARALAAAGDEDGARTIYQALSEERSYYGFLAADRLDTQYQFGHRTIEDDPAVQALLAANPDIERAAELFHVGLFGPARSEWERSVRGLELAQRQQAALMADRWGWHSQAIRTLAYSGGQNDLLRSYPTPFKADYDEHTSKADIARTWAYGVTRAESLFMSDVKSSAGAIGLMQLLPRTGKETARRARVPYSGLQTLLDPQANITLGVHYLGQMYKRFDEHQVLATAAYNAGARRVRSWLPERGNIPADVWIETIPFNETRNYVQKVLFADTVFHWRLTGSERRLASRMPPIGQLD